MSNPSNELPLINTKNLWCRDARVAEIKKILGIYKVDITINTK